MSLRLFDTYTRRMRDFVPLCPPQVRMYTCGPTVYDYAHLGNLRTYIFADLLRRVAISWHLRPGSPLHPERDAFAQPGPPRAGRGRAR
jgi:hypothetical protein